MRAKPKYRPRSSKPALFDLIEAAYKAGYAPRDIAKWTGHSRARISVLARMMGLRCKRGGVPMKPAPSVFTALLKYQAALKKRTYDDAKEVASAYAFSHDSPRGNPPSETGDDHGEEVQGQGRRQGQGEGLLGEWSASGCGIAAIVTSPALPPPSRSASTARSATARRRLGGSGAYSHVTRRTIGRRSGTQ